MNIDPVSLGTWIQNSLSTPLGLLTIFLMMAAGLVYLHHRMMTSAKVAAEKKAEKGETELDKAREALRLARETAHERERADLIARMGAMEMAQKIANDQCNKDRIRAAAVERLLTKQLQFFRQELVKAGVIPAASFGPEMFEDLVQRESPVHETQTLELPESQ